MCSGGTLLHFHLMFFLFSSLAHISSTTVLNIQSQSILGTSVGYVLAVFFNSLCLIISCLMFPPIRL